MSRTMNAQRKNCITILLCIFASPMTALAGNAEITDVVVSSGANGYRFDVTIGHADTGWDHYADGWEVIAADGKVLGKRVLMHPHVDEQPFTRSLGNVVIPAGVDEVVIRAHTRVAGYGPMTVAVPLTQSVQTAQYDIVR